eukprot:TRINITY_DN27677_c0_g1_i1.p1 TRINITY_DN27677_c0_g1~~TRINITY_DN27677_c0_g1_i1.p1  ORF type:complete len:231 (+),score=36.74 TRINITY_DN27677_c0_g1_i1:109-801(+)
MRTPANQRGVAGLLRYTKMCSFFLSGGCQRGENCTFAHSQDQLMEQPELTKTVLCGRFSRKGRCNQGDACKYAHGFDDLRTCQRNLRKGPGTSQNNPRRTFQEIGGRTPQTNPQRAVQAIGERTPPTNPQRAVQEEALEDLFPIQIQLNKAALPLAQGSNPPVWEGCCPVTSPTMPPTPPPTSPSSGSNDPLASPLSDYKVKNTFVHFHIEDADVALGSAKRCHSMPASR